ncbi:MAG: NUDIX domain-containing protein [Planctomycetes bacterium]|nr:NUDIX domain-containing protein [Planctomycetota bacterium]
MAMEGQAAHQVVVYVYRQTASGPRYLVLRQDRVHEGLWRPVLGTVRPEEALDRAAIREVRAETGILHPRSLVDFGFLHRERFGDFDLIGWGLGYDVGLDEPKIKLGADYREFRWLAFDEAYQTIEFDAFREAVLKLHMRLVG